MNIGFISLGCPKNTIDTEIMIAILKKKGYRIVNEAARADMVIINTCGFINDAKEEAIETIIEMGSLKEEGIIKYIIATGCLAQRYGQELLDEMPELDAVVGISSFLRIDEVVKMLTSGEKKRIIEVMPPTEFFIEKGDRFLTTPPGTAYLKIAEGCNNRCSYCAIPLIRGNLRSKSLKDIEEEARILVEDKGVKELVIIAQDTAAYGVDIYGESRLPQVIDILASFKGLEWIRLMYLHPRHIDEKIIDKIGNTEKVIPYLDIPVQHFATPILKRMNRQHDGDYLKEIIDRLRAAKPGLVLRTTVMVGFPGEKEDDFQKLYDFIGEVEFDWLGCFAFNPEEDTAAYTMPEQVPDEVKKKRVDEIMRLQKKITRKKNITRVNKKEKILVTSRLDKNLYAGRGYFQAPEVDGVTLIKSEKSLVQGEFTEVILKGVRGYDMIGVTLD
ncbi:SSU ribosomal protein S12P methylthiotransferase [Thermosyntropha lipolytica DSM 11003]|uniref:Ribosomal protein uS12 methylthiotransferase RimO n=1 Tax=Thermosyntropha lipolytica DSM 11003 TaxID=1123382 RepID=A0A1M5RGC1_9FIRM|nr:30S ribosomal protein S12 methylthiotransferase RimO [Thermosyntropha lipolytica]SHH25079.1 SSU ribosomal protein S12P methylthiotransferase [Thermosyntropha lipolytica DSM 11003]